jgi:hypothetical protein
MRFPLHNLALSILAAASALSAQDAWSSFADRLRAEANPQGPWILVLRPQDVGPWALDPDLGRLLTTREFRIEGLRENPAGGAPANAPSQAPRWLILAPGAERQKEGRGRLDGRLLLEELRSLGCVPRWERREAFLKLHPNHGPARIEGLQETLGLGLARLRAVTGGPTAFLARLGTNPPDAVASTQLAEDARLLRARVKADEGWTPEPGLWQWAALKVLPTLDADLECWPDQARLWRDWLAWAKLHPRQPSALFMAQRLPLWGEAASWSSRLPTEVHKAVAEELRISGRFEDMRQWFQAAWDGVDKRSRGRGPGTPGWLLVQRRNIQETLVAPLREALIAQRRDAEVVALDREVAAWLGEGVKLR